MQDKYAITLSNRLQRTLKKNMYINRLKITQLVNVSTILDVLKSNLKQQN